MMQKVNEVGPDFKANNKKPDIEMIDSEYSHSLGHKMFPSLQSKAECHHTQHQHRVRASNKARKL